nr:LOW QUALITY PROTEIN: uncharacterized WD repeat-containing protein alr3466-like [Lytechinus pictus]
MAPPCKPTGMLRGHNAPIFSLFIAPTENRIYSISQDKTIKVWDTKDQVCMLTIRPKTHKIRGDLQAAHYNITSKAFIVATDQMAMLTHRVKSLELREIPTTHRTPILCARYNSEFKNVVTTSDASVVKLWDFETGHLVFEFSQAHNNSAITALTFDNTGRRLITGGRDGRLKIWNYNNGHCLKMLEKADGNDEVTDVVYIEMNKNRYVISVGWDRSINVYTDSSEDFRHIQRPMPRWTDDEKNGHQEDILSVSACPPSLLATSSYDGEIIVWNLVSGYAYSHIQSTKYFDDHDERDTKADGDESISKVLFIPSRRTHKGAAQLVASGPRGYRANNGYDISGGIMAPPCKPTGMLRGHNAPIFSLFIAPTENRIYSISQDKTIKVWDTKDQVCMLTIRPKTHKIRGDLQAAHYNITSKAFIVATDQMAMLTHRVKSKLLHLSLELREIPTTHRTPILCARYNSEFKNVVTTSDASVVKLWDFETGHLVFEFSQAHNNSAITALTFDNTGRRLITGGRDGRLKIWNYNNGHCLKMLEKADGNDEVTDVVYIEMNKNRYVISVGWDRSINVYTDSSEDFRHIQRPMPRWTDDEKNGHQEDILSVSACPPSLLATSSYDGEIIVWNLVSGYAYSHIQSTKYFDDHDERYKADGDESISKVLFIPSRRTHKGAAQLVASGPRGCIHFWNVYNNGQLYGRFNCVKKKGASVNCMQLSNDDLTLFTGDSLGFVSVWDIDHYCLDRPENIEEAPELLGSWRGHIQSITSMNLVEERSVLITSSLDCTVRLWTTEGHYVGTFGQDEPWDIFNPTTFKHPMVPYDVLVDPQSMPNHPIFDQKSTSSLSEYICDESLDDGQAGGDVDILDDGSSQGDENGEKEEVEEREDDKKSESTSYISTNEKFVYDDEMIAAELKKKPFNRGSGKRLRHEKLRSMPKERAVTSAYQTLKCFDLEDTPPLSPPTRSKDKTSDPFTFS